MRGHNPVIIENFNGLWKRGGEDSTPPDHFVDCDNIQFIHGGFRSRDGIDTFLGNNTTINNIVRMYTFVQESGQSVLVLDNNNNIYDVQGTTVLGPILHVKDMTDFAFVSMNGRAYLSPSNGITGLVGEFIYVYDGAGAAARRAGGASPLTAPVVVNSGTAGNVELGIHVFSVVYETNTGFLTSIGPAVMIDAPGGKKVDISSISVSGSASVTKVHIVATRAIDPLFFTGDLTGYQFYFVPGAIVTNGTTTLSVSFFDSELLDSADHLQDLYESIPAVVGLGNYHNRLIGYSTHSDISLCIVSNPGEPEAINQIDGLLVFPLDGKPITNGQEFRDVLYLFKQTKTNAWTDNGDVPSSWPMTLLDQGIGASLHGIATVLDSGGVNVDYLEITDYSGIFLFNGAYVRTELSWKIKDFWLALARNKFNKIEIKNDPISQTLYLVTTDGNMLIGDYSNGMTPKEIRWAPWSFTIPVNSIALTDTNTLLIGSSGIPI